MTKEQIVSIRDMFHNAGIKVVIQGDNSIYADECLDCVIWDDDNELVYSLSRTKTSSPIEYPCEEKVVYYTVFGYDVIQYITCSSGYEKFKKDIIDNIPINDDERKEKILAWFRDIKNGIAVPKPGTRTLEQIKEEDPELYAKIFSTNTSIHSER